MSTTHKNISATIRTTLEHIGMINLLAISGGRFVAIDEDTVNLPVHYGYTVEIKLNRGQDLYEVRRMFRRGLKVWTKGTESGIYADQLGDSAYRASCYLDEFGGES